MNSTYMNKSIDAGSAYTSDPRIPTSEHFTRIDAFGPLITLRVVVSEDPLGFSYERMLQGEADMRAGRVRSFPDLINALRARVRRHRR
jgi:hypothetical protein